jgi:hypothetical protein
VRFPRPTTLRRTSQIIFFLLFLFLLLKTEFRGSLHAAETGPNPRSFRTRRLYPREMLPLTTGL